MDAEELKKKFFALRQAAESAAFEWMYACPPDTPERELASQMYENIRAATRGH